MTLVELAQFLIENNETVYCTQGKSLVTRGILEHSMELQNTTCKLHACYTDVSLSTLDAEGNAMFCLIVNEAMK